MNDRELLDRIIASRSAQTGHRAAAQAKRGRNDGQRAGLALACLAFVLSLAFYVTPDSETATYRQAAAQNATPQNDDDLTTGSVVFVPPYGNACRLRFIDNATWLFFGDTIVPCQAAMREEAAPVKGKWSAARVDAIRGSFSKK